MKIKAKPGWSSAPYWALYLAKQGDTGEWCWFEHDPEVDYDSKRFYLKEGRVVSSGVFHLERNDWLRSIERRER